MHRTARATACLLLLTALVVSIGLAWPADPPSGGNTSARHLGSGGRGEQPLSASRRLDDAGRWESVLARLFARRAAAYAAGEPGRLSAVHVSGSPVFQRDVSVVQAWVRRGLSVDGATVRVHTAELLRRVPRSAVLRTVDRLGSAVAVSAGGDTQPLPRDRLSAHRIMLTRTSAGWRIAAVHPLTG